MTRGQLQRKRNEMVALLQEAMPLIDWFAFSDAAQLSEEIRRLASTWWQTDATPDHLKLIQDLCDRSTSLLLNSGVSGAEGMIRKFDSARRQMKNANHRKR